MQQDSAYTEKLITIVDDVYTRHAGPFASIICDDALDKWREKERVLHFMHLPAYIDELISELPDDRLKREFVISLRESEEITSHIALQTYLEKLF